MEATTVGFKVPSWSSLTKQNKVSFLSPLTSFLQIKTLRTPPPPPNQQKKKNKKGVKHGVSSSHERVMIRRGLNLSCIIRGSSAGPNNNHHRIITTTTSHHQIPKLQDTNHRHLRLGCVLTSSPSSSEMADSVNKVMDKKHEEEEGSVDLKTKGEATPPPPSPPEKPLPGDCCGNGCIPCVWDTYNEELEDYNKLLKAYHQSSQSQSKP